MPRTALPPPRCPARAGPRSPGACTCGARQLAVAARAVDRDVQQGKGAKAQETTVQNAPVVQRIGEPVLPEAVDPVARFLEVQRPGTRARTRSRTLTLSLALTLALSLTPALRLSRCRRRTSC